MSDSNVNTSSLTRPPFRRRRLVGFSTKLYLDFDATISYVQNLCAIFHSEFKDQYPDPCRDLDIFIIPDHVSIHTVASALSKDPTGQHILVGAQDVHWEERGAFTGEVSARTLRQVGCQIVELGHAERRRMFGETDEIVTKKVKAVLKAGMMPLVCIGEQSRPAGEVSTAEEIRTAVEECRVQVEAVVAGLERETDCWGRLVFAYEPVWAISADRPAGVDHINAVAKGIRRLECLEKGPDPEGTRIIYGGSAGPGLYHKLKDELDGLFLGRFAHDPEQFYKTIMEVYGA